MNCAYCHRIESENEPHISDELIEELKSMGQIHINFYGGEPTLYMDDIRKVVEAMPKNSYRITTNGILFDKYREFFLKYNFKVTFSYDGNNRLRSKDVLDRPIEFPFINISCTLFHGNTDLEYIMHQFNEKEKVIAARISLFPHIMHMTSESNKEYTLTREDYTSLIEQIKKYVSKYVIDFEKYGILNYRINGLFILVNSLLNNNYEYGETYCVHKGIRKIDSSGTMYTCLYMRDDKLSPDTWQRDIADVIDKNFTDCKTCFYYKYCGSACIKSKEHDLECYFYKRLIIWGLQFRKQHLEAFEELSKIIRRK
jgi:hypothetical protein